MSLAAVVEMSTKSWVLGGSEAERTKELERPHGVFAFISVLFCSDGE